MIAAGMIAVERLRQRGTASPTRKLCSQTVANLTGSLSQNCILRAELTEPSSEFSDSCTHVF